MYWVDTILNYVIITETLTEAKNVYNQWVSSYEDEIFADDRDCPHKLVFFNSCDAVFIMSKDQYHNWCQKFGGFYYIIDKDPLKWSYVNYYSDKTVDKTVYYHKGLKRQRKLGDESFKAKEVMNNEQIWWFYCRVN